MKTSPAAVTSIPQYLCISVILHAFPPTGDEFPMVRHPSYAQTESQCIRPHLAMFPTGLSSLKRLYGDM